MEKIPNQKAWFLVLPVFVLVAFSAIIPLMTVVNYSVQDTFGNNQFFWNGVSWFSDVLESDRFWQAMGNTFSIFLLSSVPQVIIAVFVAAVLDDSADAEEWTDLEDYAATGAPLPERGAVSIVLDGSGHPRALVATADVQSTGDRVREQFRLLYPTRAHR